MGPQYRHFAGKYENGVFQIEIAIPGDEDGGLITIELTREQAGPIAQWMLDELKPKKGVDPAAVALNEETFERFWEAYPKKVGKRETRAAWVTTKAATHIDEILADIERRKGGEQWRGGYVLDPVRYVRRRRWEDSEEQQADNRILVGVL